MAFVWEFQVDGDDGCGWKGWRVAVLVGKEEREYSFDERDGVTSAGEAIQRTFEDFDGVGGLVLGVTPIRTLVSAEINPN